MPSTYLSIGTSLAPLGLTMEINKQSRKLILLGISNIALLTCLICNQAISETKLADPTRPDFLNDQSRTTVKKQPSTRFNLQQILITPKRKSAVINGKSLQVGQKVNGASLIAIYKDKVQLSFQGKLINLYLTYAKNIKEINR